ncbi:MAG: DHH family phosphoesterase, partial [Phycisphaerales bacterium]
FKYSNVTPDTLALASRLLASGVNHARLYQLTEQTDDPSRPRLLGKALSSLEFHADGRIALMCLRQSDFDATGAGTEDTGGFAESVMAVAGVSVVCTLTEMSRPGQPTQLTKGSLRSKPGPHAIDVAAVTATLGGGGHARAAGVKLAMPIEQARAAVLQALSAACASAHAAIPGT